ncbi:MAG: Maf family protein [Fimbriiglobus sp.]
MKLILASGSLGRRELMKLHGYSFTVQPSNIDEPTEAVDGDIRRYVGELAWRKAANVAARITEDAVVIAADTVGWINGHVVGKPEDEADARRILTELSGTTHELWSGVCVWVTKNHQQICWQELSHVRMKALTQDELTGYLQTRKWVGCSGAYAIQMPTDPYLEVVSGTVSNVIGLPMETLAKVLKLVEELRAI